MSQDRVKQAWNFLLFAVAVAVVLTLPDWAQAASGGGTGGPLMQVYTDLSSWTTGTVGKVTALSIGLIGAMAGLAKHSLMPMATGVFAGMALANFPTIIDSVFSASLYLN